MNCNCIGETEKMVAEKIAEKIGAPVEAKCEAIGFSIGSGIGLVHLTNFKVTSEAKGWKRGKSIPVQASFCPFCGKSAKE